MIDETLQHIRSSAKSLGWTAAELARRAGVSWATVCDFEDPNWSPTVKTLRKVEKALEQAGAKQPRRRKPAHLPEGRAA